MTVMGLDIGYSNVGIVVGEHNRPVGHQLPAGAGPQSELPHQLASDRARGIEIELDGESWMAGVEPARLAAGSRDLHGDYTESLSYRALFYAALSCCDTSTIKLVTGLPVGHWRDDTRRERLIERLSGTHDIGRGRRVTVDSVAVVPQPAGAYIDWVENTNDHSIIESGRVLIVDPGFYSVDWVVIEAGEIHRQSSGSSTWAMSAVIERMDQALYHAFGARAGATRIERDIRSQRQNTLVGGESVDLNEHLNTAAAIVAPRALRELQQSMRAETSALDLVLLTGGGAKYFKAAAENLFKGCRVSCLADPVMSNARGFWSMGA